MKYKSELINEIVENEGHCSSSLHYESECIDYWIESIRGAYPKLCDYEGEWLEYYLENAGIGKFPYLAIDNITSTTIENTVPIPFKSAILKGNSIKNYKNNLFDNVLEKGTISISTGAPNESNLRCYRSVNFIPINGNFKIAKYGIDGDLHVCFYDSNKSFISGQSYVLRKVLEGNATVTPPTNSSFIKFYNPYDVNEPTGEFGFGVMAENEIIELEIQSVKMPVLTTTGKNLFDGEIEEGQFDSNGNPSNYVGRTRSKNFIKVPKNTDLYISIGGANSASWTTIYLYNDKKEHTETTNTMDANKTFNTGNNSYIKWKNNSPMSQITNIQIEEGSVATSYEPYKSNILTVNEEVELRGIGDVKDELDCLTGELTQRVSGLECIDQNSKLSQSGTSNDTTLVVTISIKSNYTSGKRGLVSSHELIKYTQLDNWYGNLSIIFRLPKSNENFATLTAFKQFLTQNPFYYYRELEKEEISIKTVDLSIKDESGNNVSKLKAMNGITHIETNGTPLNPTFSGEIPVEAITQNIYSFIEEE